jgi:uncharacterized protein
MIKKFAYFLPNLKQCWWLFFFFVIPGGILSSVSLLFPTSEIMTKPVAYILAFVPIFLYITYKSNKIILEMQSTGVQAKMVKVNQPWFGKMNPILFFIVIALALVSISILLDPITSKMNAPEWFENAMGRMLEGNKYITFLTIVILAPLFEEFLCRGIMTRGLLERNYSPAAAILWSAFFFAIIHLNPWQAVPAFVLGLFFGWIYYKTRCLWATIFLHALNNSISFLLVTLYPHLSTTDSLRDILPDSDLYWRLFAIAAGVGALSFFIINKYIGSQNQNEEHKETIIPS